MKQRYGFGPHACSRQIPNNHHSFTHSSGHFSWNTSRIKNQFSDSCKHPRDHLYSSHFATGEASTPRIQHLSGKSTNTYDFGQVAQLVEHRIENPGVGSSILPLSTLFDGIGF